MSDACVAASLLLMSSIVFGDARGPGPAHSV
jgi:hypothetical protein